jgi:hypothetical protein
VLAPVPILFKSAAAPVLSAVFTFDFPSPALIIAVQTWGLPAILLGIFLASEGHNRRF